MSFLSAAFLFALPLVALPIAIHLYRGRQRDTISWGAMQFLAEAVTKGRRMERLEELLLMLLRVATVLALVLALAQPMLRSSLFGSSENREIVLIVDNSLSMSREVEDQSASEKMKEQVEELLAELDGGDRVQIMLASGPQWLTLEAIAADGSGKQQLGTLLDQVEPTEGSADLLASLQTAINLQPTDNPASRRVVLFTDNQQQSWHLESAKAWSRLETTREELELPTTIEIIDCEPKDAVLNNLAVMGLEASRLHARPGESISFTARIANVGQTESGESTIEWLFDNEVVDTSPLKALDAGQSTSVAITLPVKEAGQIAISCLIDTDDQIPLDQTGTVVVEISDRIPILIVHDDERDFSKNSADRLLTASLGYRGEEALKWHSVYQPDLANSQELSEISLADYRAVIITNLGDINGQVRERLLDFVKQGGGLWMALGDRIEIAEFNSNWYDDGQGTSPLMLQDLRTGGQDDDAASMIHPPSQDHPATTTLANTTQLDIDQARVYEYWQFAQSGESATNVSIVLEAGDGTPLVVEKYLGQGRALLQTFPIGLGQSNLPQLKSFPVMVQDWLDYLTAPSTARYNLTPGTAIVASPVVDGGAAEASLHRPNGEVVPLVVQEVEGRPVARYSQTQTPGMYQAVFTFGDKIVASMPFHVAREAEESRYKPIDPKQREKLATLSGVSFDGTESEAATNVQSLPRQEPIWGMLLGALVVLFGGELVLSHLLAQQRSGVAVSTN